MKRTLLKLYHHLKRGEFKTVFYKFRKFLHRNDWAKAHSPTFLKKCQTEWFFLCHRQDCIIIDGFLIKFYRDNISFMNWGDDINVYFLELATGKKVLPAQMLLFRHQQFTAIGSVIPACINHNTIVWGSGVINSEIAPTCKPQKVCAVRGPLTRKYLLDHGIECPDVYGDPALLLPKFYQPKVLKKRYKVSIIPHHMDYDAADFEEFASSMGYHLINMAQYDKWTDVIDEIVQSEVVLSSSLHGLIVSDAYGIPNLFCEFVHRHACYDKYVDYYGSIGKDFMKESDEKVLNISDVTDETVAAIRDGYFCPRIDVDELWETCPFGPDKI